MLHTLMRDQTRTQGHASTRGECRVEPKVAGDILSAMNFYTAPYPCAYVRPYVTVIIPSRGCIHPNSRRRSKSRVSVEEQKLEQQPFRLLSDSPRPTTWPSMHHAHMYRNAVLAVKQKSHTPSSYPGSVFTQGESTSVSSKLVR